MGRTGGVMAAEAGGTAARGVMAAAAERNARPVLTGAEGVRTGAGRLVGAVATERWGAAALACCCERLVKSTPTCGMGNAQVTR